MTRAGAPPAVTMSGPSAAQSSGSPWAVSSSFNPPVGVLCTVPSRYFCAISVPPEYLALEGSYLPFSLHDKAGLLAARAVDRPLSGSPSVHLSPLAPKKLPTTTGGPVTTRPVTFFGSGIPPLQLLGPSCGRATYRPKALSLHCPGRVVVRGLQGRAIACSLAATGAISVDFFSSPYLYA